MIKTHSLACRSGEHVIITNKFHAETFLVTTIATSGGNLDIGEELVTSFCLALVVFIAVRGGGLGTTWYLVTTPIIETTWLARIAIWALVTVETLGIVSMLYITDTGHVFVAVLVSLALVGVLAQVGVLVADLTRLAVKSSVVATRATT